MRLIYLDRQHVFFLCVVTAELYPTTPLAFQLRGEQGLDLLDSALAVPRSPYHRSLAQKAAALHYHLNKNHPFIDGNKRFAVAAMEVFIWLNDATLYTTDEMMEQISLDIARDALSLEQLTAFVSPRLVRDHWSDEQLERWLKRIEKRGHTDVLSELDAVAKEANPPSLSERIAGIMRRQLLGG